MNRIVLLGNGFDLAHGLPTTYKDFVFNYLYGVVNKKEHHDEYITYVNNHMGVDFSNVKTIKEILDTMSNKSGIQYNFKNSFLNSALHNLSLNNWIDLEMHYYSRLKSYIDWDQGLLNGEGNIKAFNDSFELVKLLLEAYLVNNVKNLYKWTAFQSFIDLFHQDISEDDFSVRRYLPNKKPNITTFLNFNYTNTIEEYLTSIRGEVKLISIHGQLNNKDNPIVFGFGDEKDRKYSELENLNSNELFRHIKSHMYLQTSNYHDLTRIVETDEYQIYIIGHSCGLSDRTMLSHLFNHGNCKSIKIFYNKSKNNFIETTHEISRHFEDKNFMRMKIVPFDKSEPCPQVQLEKV